MAIDPTALARDILAAKNSPFYGEADYKQYYLRYLAPGQLSPIRAYFRFWGDWWATVVEFSAYPLPAGSRLKDVVVVVFEYRIPPCPEHRINWHPNVFSQGGICWGDTHVPGRTVMRVERLLDTVYGLLVNPNHGNPTHKQCKWYNRRILGI